MFWQRVPDQSGWDYWTAQVAVQGRASVLTSFANSTAFTEVAGTLYRETLWLIADNLGTPRMVAERTGSLAGIKRHDYLPFGEEVLAGVSSRTSQQERNKKTNLDYFGARYYASAQGRFTGLDSVLVTQESFVNPQHYNLYIYVNNNPLVSVDSDGNACTSFSPKEMHKIFCKRYMKC